MLLSAKLYRSTSRSFKAFPSGRIGENTSNLVSADAKTKKEQDVDQLQEPLPSPTSYPQLEVNTSNLKFRKSKKKAKEGESSMPEVVEEFQGELSKMLLGSTKSDFENWLENSDSIQAPNKSDADLEKSEEEVHSPNNLHDSVISSCNASDCSDEDKTALINEWSMEKFCKTANKTMDEEVCATRSSYSSGCHSMTASSSGIVSDSEGVSPSCNSPQREPQDIVTLQDELDKKIIDLAQYDYDAVFKTPEPEVQFQLVQNKKKMKPKLKQGEKKEAIEVQLANGKSNSYNDISKKQRKKKNFSFFAGSSKFNNQTAEANIQSSSDPSQSSSQENSVSIQRPPTSTAHALSSFSVTTLPAESMKAEKWNATKAGRKARKECSTKLSASVTDVVPSNTQPLDSMHKVPLPDSETSQSEKPSMLPEAGCMTTEANCLKQEIDVLNARKAEPEMISFGSGCKDLDIFPLSTPSECPQIAAPRNAQDGCTKKQNSKTMFNLKQAQQFLLQAYDAVEKQRIKDSGSVLYYS